MAREAEPEFMLRDWRRIQQKQLSDILGVSTRAIHKWGDECPRNEDGTYSLPMVIQWRMSKMIPLDPLCDLPEEEASDPEAVDRHLRDRPPQYRLIHFKAEREKIRLEYDRRDNIPRSEVHEVFMLMGQQLRSAGQTLLNQYGEPAMQVLVDALDEMQRLVKPITEKSAS